MLPYAATYICEKGFSGCVIMISVPERAWGIILQDCNLFCTGLGPRATEKDVWMFVCHLSFFGLMSQISIWQFPPDTARMYQKTGSVPPRREMGKTRRNPSRAVTDGMDGSLQRTLRGGPGPRAFWVIAFSLCRLRLTVLRLRRHPALSISYSSVNHHK